MLTNTGRLRGKLRGGASGTEDYSALKNKPQINGVELVGDKSLDDLGIDIPTKTSELDNDSGYTSSTVIAEAYDETSTYAVGAYVTHENNLYKCNTAITTAEEWNAEHWTLVDVISAIPTKTSELDNDSGFITGDNYYDKSEIDTALSNKYEKKLTQTLKVGQSILTEASVVLGANWSGTLESGISHSSGSTDSLEFNIPTTNGKAYLVTFDATGVNNTTALNVKIGDLPLVDVYTGRTDFVVGFVSDGGNLIFTPQSNYSGTITNLKLREVTNEGDEVTFTVKNVTTEDNTDGLSGFWNVALGFSSFENNVNGSRNVAIGFESLKTFKTGTRNLALGTYAMNRLESGERNIAVGADSMWYTKVANDCIAFGHNSMSGVGTDLANNVAIGRDTLGVITTGKNNVAIGYGALVNPQTNSVSSATAIGANAGNYGHTYGTYIGNRAGYFMKGISNTCIGYGSGAQQNASGARNTFIGATCGIDNTGATAQNPKNVDDSVVIGYGAKATKSKQMMLGSTDITEVVMCGDKKIKFNNDGTVTWETLT